MQANTLAGLCIFYCLMILDLRLTDGADTSTPSGITRSRVLPIVITPEQADVSPIVITPDDTCPLRRIQENPDQYQVCLFRGEYWFYKKDRNGSFQLFCQVPKVWTQDRRITDNCFEARNLFVVITEPPGSRTTSRGALGRNSLDDSIFNDPVRPLVLTELQKEFILECPPKWRKRFQSKKKEFKLCFNGRQRYLFSLYARSLCRIKGDIEEGDDPRKIPSPCPHEAFEPVQDVPTVRFDPLVLPICEGDKELKQNLRNFACTYKKHFLLNWNGKLCRFRGRPRVLPDSIIVCRNGDLLKLLQNNGIPHENAPTAPAAGTVQQHVVSLLLLAPPVRAEEFEAAPPSKRQKLEDSLRRFGESPSTPRLSLQVSNIEIELGPPVNVSLGNVNLRKFRSNHQMDTKQHARQPRQTATARTLNVTFTLAVAGAAAGGADFNVKYAASLRDNVDRFDGGGFGFEIDPVSIMVKEVSDTAPATNREHSGRLDFIPYLLGATAGLLIVISIAFFVLFYKRKNTRRNKKNTHQALTRH